MESVQRQATRYVQDVSNLPYHMYNRLLHLNLPTLSYRRSRFRADMIMTYNIFKLHNNVDLNPNELFQFYSNSITRGHDYKYSYKPYTQRLVRSS